MIEQAAISKADYAIETFDAQPASSSALQQEVDISIICPAYNEQLSLPILYQRLVEVLEKLKASFEIILVDDGSTDSTAGVMDQIAKIDPRVKAIHFVRNFGQTAAFSAGIDIAKGDVLITIDADLQNDPKDIVNLLKGIDEGYDVVSGWRKDRKDPFINRILPSLIANKIISTISGIGLHDYGCSLKAYRKEVLKGVKLYGEMHRFIPIYAAWMGAKVTEIPVRHHPRTMGSSKYGISRTIKVVLDLLTIKFLFDYGTKPSYIFGSLGLLSILLSFLTLGWAVILKFFFATTLIQTPLPLLAVLFFTVGIQLVLMGLIAEVLVRTYHESQDKQIYQVRPQNTYKRK